MITIIFKLVISFTIIMGAYYFGKKEGKEEETGRLTKLCLREECYGCKKIKPVISNLEYDTRKGKIRSINIGCSKALTCRGRKDLVE